MKRNAIAIAALLIMFPALSLAADHPTFEGGQEDVVVSLAAPLFEATINIEVPVGNYVTNATMKVTGMAAAANASAYPEGVTMKLNESTIWAFQQTGFGPLGRQNQFSTGLKQVNLTFGEGGGLNTFYIRLPKDASVQSASMEVRGIPPGAIGELVNFTGSSAGDYLGCSVSNAGDVNGDGYNDLIVGAFNASVCGTNNGGAYIYYGGSDMGRIANVTLTGAATGDVLGETVSDAGDVNGDGYDDVIVGARRNSTGVTRAGRAYLYFGNKTMDSSADLIFTGINTSGELGCSVSGAGDLNNDGYDDVIIGERIYNLSTWEGRTYIYFGGPNMDNIADLTITGYLGTQFGREVANAGDVNNDGFDDVIIGSCEGKANVYFGGQNMDSTPDVMMTGTSGDFFGTAISGAGDVNNDGYDDVIVGAPDNGAGGSYAGQAYVYYGGQNMNGNADVTFTGAAAGYMVGASVSDAGDVNNDNIDDIIVGAGGGVSHIGHVYIFYGGQNMDNVADATLTGVVYDEFGGSVSDAGDINNDGYTDVIIGADHNDAGGNNTGRAYVYTCHAASLTGILNPGVSIGMKSVWKETGYFNKTVTVNDFAGEINTYLNSASISGKDSYGNAYVDVPINVNASGGGKLTFFNMSVMYSYDVAVPNFGAILNNYLVSHKNEKDTNGNIEVPIKIRSLSAGRIKLSGLDFAPDKPPALVKDIATAELDEDSWNSSLIDLYPYFQDDIDPDTNLNFSVVSSTNSSFVRLWISGKRYVSADAMTGDANDNWTGTVEAVVACTDHWGQKTESNKFTIIVKNMNDEPIITSVPSTLAEAGVPYYYNLTAVDGDNDTLHFSLPKAPANMTIDDKTGKIQWMPRAKGDFLVSLVVSDGNATAMQNFTISVPNKASRITSSPPLNATTGVQYIYNITAEDDNLDALAFSFTGRIEGMAIDSKNGTLTWMPLYTGNFDVTVSVSDGKASATQEFTVKVSQGNRVPKFMSAPVKTGTVGVSYKYQVRVMDEDNDALSVSLVVCPSGMVFDSVSGEVRWIPVAPGNFAVTLKVTDGKGGDAIQEFVINVMDKVKAKVAIDKPSENEKVKGKVTVSGMATKGTLEVVSAQVRIDGGDWTDAAGNYTWQYSLDTMKLKNGKHLLEARAFDGKDYSDLASVNFTVDNQKTQSKGFIPGFTGMVVLLSAISGAVLLFWRKRF